jgi:guanylate kinase
MSHWQEFDYVIINDDLEHAVTELESVLKGAGQESEAGSEALKARVHQIIG